MDYVKEISMCKWIKNVWLTLALAYVIPVFSQSGEWTSYKFMHDAKKDKSWYRYNISLAWRDHSPALEKECLSFFWEDSCSMSLNDYLAQFANSFEKLYNYETADCSYAYTFQLVPKNHKHVKYHCYYLKRRREDKKSGKVKERNIIYDVERDRVLTIDDVLAPQYAEEVKRKANGKFVNMLMSDNDFVWSVGTGNNLRREQIAITTQNKSKFTQRLMQLTDLDKRITALEQDRKHAAAADSLRKIMVQERREALYKGLCDHPELEPSFPGGEGVMNEWAKNQSVYPAVAEEAGITADIGCTFVVGTDGSVFDVKYYRGNYEPGIRADQKYIERALENAAIQMLEKMPKWNPGRNGDECVAVRRFMMVHVNKQGGVYGLDIVPWVKEAEMKEKALAQAAKPKAPKRTQTPMVGKQPAERVVSSVSFTPPEIKQSDTNSEEELLRKRGWIKEEPGKEVLKAKEAIPEETEADRQTVYDRVERMPEFPGGQASLLKWISENINYPAEAKAKGIQGRVVCTFIVECDGSITDIRVARSIDPSLDREAVRVLKKMPQWIPGRQKGSPVRVKYTVPVTFKLH